MSRDDVRRKVLRLLTMRSEPICDACIERELEYPIKTVNPVNNEFLREERISRGIGICPVCQKPKLVNTSCGPLP